MEMNKKPETSNTKLETHLPEENQLNHRGHRDFYFFQHLKPKT
jgi:hypothetical protein